MTSSPDSNFLSNVLKVPGDSSATGKQDDREPSSELSSTPQVQMGELLPDPRRRGRLIVHITQKIILCAIITVRALL